jgi:hypothetical protein
MLLEPIDQKVEMVQQYMDLNQQLDSVISRVGKIESSIAQISQSSITQQTLLLETIHKLTENLASVTALLDQQTKMSAKLESRVSELMQLVSSRTLLVPAAGANNGIASIAGPAAGAKRTLNANDFAEHIDEDAPPKKQIRMPSDAKKQHDVNIASELERLHSTGVLRAKKMVADKKGEVVTKRALFDPTYKYWVGYNQDMLLEKHGGKKYNTNAMTVAAIVIDDTEWNQLFDESLDSDAIQEVAGCVTKKVHDRIKALEIRYLERSPDDLFLPLKNMRSVSDKWNKILKVMKSEIQFDEWLSQELGETSEETEELI